MVDPRSGRGSLDFDRAEEEREHSGNSHILFQESGGAPGLDRGSHSARINSQCEFEDYQDEEIPLNPTAHHISSYYKKRTNMDARLENFVVFLKKNWKLWVACGVIALFFILLAVFTEAWGDLQWRAWFSISITVLMLMMLLEESLNPAFVFMIVQSLILVMYYTWEECIPCGIESDGQDCETSRALQGFSNSGVLTVGILFIVAKGIEMSSVLKYFIKYVLRKPANLLDAQVRLLVPVLVFSAFLNNTPVVAMMIPVIENWAVQCRLNASYLLMPLSYAAIMGGTCSLIGTSSNVIIAGLVAEDPYSEPYFPDGVGFFAIAIVGVPGAICGIIYILIFSRLLLPGGDKEKHDKLSENQKISEKERNSLEIDEKDQKDDGFIADFQELDGRQNFILPILVTSGSALEGHTLKQSGLLDMEGVALVKVITRSLKEARGGERGERGLEVSEEYTVFEQDNLSLEYQVKAGDTLYFSGTWEAVQTVFSLDGVVPATVLISQVTGKRNERCIVHVVLSPRSELVGKTLAEIDMIQTFNAAVVAISRQDFPVRVDDLEEVVFCAGDVLVLETTTNFVEKYGNSPHFALVVEKRSGSLTPRRVSFSMFFVCSLAVLMIALSAADVLNLLPGGFVVASIYILAGVMTWNQAKSAINVDVLFVIAAAFGLGNALQDTCAANTIAESLLEIFKIGGELGILFGLYISVAGMSAVISNSACVTLMYPIAKNFAMCTPSNSVVISYDAAVFTLMLAGSACFATPIGYQTNLMVMTPGNYSTLDFVKFGIPLTLINMVVVCVLVRYIWPSDGC